MNINDDDLLSKLVFLRASKGWSQKDVGQALSATQGHLSKLLAKKVPLSAKMRAKIKIFLDRRGAKEAIGDEFEEDLIVALRHSALFRDLVSTALEMHKYALRRK